MLTFIRDVFPQNGYKKMAPVWRHFLLSIEYQALDKDRFVILVTALPGGHGKLKLRY